MLSEVDVAVYVIVACTSCAWLTGRDARAPLYLYLIGQAPYIEPVRDLIRASFNRIRVLTSFFNSAGDNGLSGVKRIVPLLVGKFLSSSL